MVPKTLIKSATWRGAYENWNVDHGLASNLPGKGQIGKGMWAIPDQVSEKDCVIFLLLCVVLMYVPLLFLS